MTDLLAPPVPADCDLRSQTWMPLDLSMLLDAEALADMAPDEWQLQIVMIARSWGQVPATSLPDNPAAIAQLFGKNSAKIREKVAKILENPNGIWKRYGNRWYCMPIQEQAANTWQRLEKKRNGMRQYRAENNARGGNVPPHSTAQHSTNISSYEDIGSPPASRVPPDAPAGPSPAGAVETPPASVASSQPLPKPAEKPKAKPPPADRGTRLPSPWPLTDGLLEIALKEGLTPDDARSAHAEFCDFWAGVPGQRGRKCDWVATWRNRCRETLGRIRSRRPAIAQTGGNRADPQHDRPRPVAGAVDFERGVRNMFDAALSLELRRGSADDDRR